MKENSIEEDMKIIEQIKDIFLYLKFHGWINDIKQDIDTDKAIRTLEHILSDYKRVLKENEELKHKYDIFVKMNSEVIENSISKQKIKDKIEEINKKEKQELKGTKGQDRYSIKQQYMYQRNVLQDLLEEKGE